MLLVVDHVIGCSDCRLVDMFWVVDVCFFLLFGLCCVEWAVVGLFVLLFD